MAYWFHINVLPTMFIVTKTFNKLAGADDGFSGQKRGRAS